MVNGTRPAPGLAVMKKRLRALYLLLSSFAIGMLHVPFAGAKPASGKKASYTRVSGHRSGGPADSLQMFPRVLSVYDSLQLDVRGLSREAFEYAQQGFDRLLQEGRLTNDSIISIIDFSKPSTEKRMFILDMRNYRILFQTLVSHGRNSGQRFATRFSNQHSSYMSSPGFYITRETYQGKNGYSLKLEGIEPGINDNAYERGIVVHGAAYVNETIGQAQGYIGRSQGCPAVPSGLAAPVINRIRNGSLMFIYHPAYNSRLIGS